MSHASGISNSVGTTLCGGSSEVPEEFAQTQLQVSHVMNPDVSTISPTETVFSAVRKMTQNHVSCIVVVDNEAVVGILAEQDVLTAIAEDDRDFTRARVADRMSCPVHVVEPDMPILEAGRIMEAEGIKRLPVIWDSQLVGIVTQTDITRGLVYISPLQDVCEIMSREIATVDATATVAEAVQIMARQKISCVVAVQRTESVGILTQKDVLHRVIAVHKDPSTTVVTEVMSCPVLTIPSTYSVFTAGRAMDKMYIHRLVVKDGERVCGLVSQTDIMRAVRKRLQLEERRRQLLTTSDIPMCALDLDGAITYVNPAFVQLLEIDDLNTVIAQPFLPEDFWIDPADRTCFLEGLDQEDGTLSERALRTAAGREIQVALFMKATRETSGQADGWQIILWDITNARATASRSR